MHQIDHVTAVASRPVALSPGTPGWFDRGNSATGVKGTVVPADYMNDVMANILAVLTAASVTPTKGSAGDNDLLNAIRTLISSMSFSTGDIKSTLKAVADPGWVMFNDGTIGDASSGATTRANADCQALFTLVWTNTSASDCPLFTSANAPVAKGGSAAADWAAHRRLALPVAVGHALACAGVSALPGGVITTRALGHHMGEENHLLVGAEMPNHGHTGTTNSAGDHAHTGGAAANGAQATGGTLVAGTSGNTGTAGAHTHTFTTDAVGGNGAHNTMQPTVFFNVMIKL